MESFGRKNRASQLNQRHSYVYRSAVNFSRGWQTWRTQDDTLGQVRKIWAVWLLHLPPCCLPSSSYNLWHCLPSSSYNLWHCLPSSSLISDTVFPSSSYYLFLSPLPVFFGYSLHNVFLSFIKSPSHSCLPLSCLLPFYFLSISSLVKFLCLMLHLLSFSFIFIAFQPCFSFSYN